ncbi:type II toxin-antitoxin system PemK/MazF family toxin [Candidatus Chloroploca sp. M-50]|uniref:mRNA interferase n=2 Tax=Candidatus Chloroploca mongolica TaxID=2528176 RepID=A0ABS4DGY1_9CHLR|nr:type II toxin-antitoxin system PemK/MazF family toxin [Candidatus Chloroploca mongolica]
MVMQRGDVWWANLPDASGSGPAFRRPVLLVQADAFTRSRIATVIVAVITSNLRLAAAPGNVVLRARESGLPKDSVINVSQLITLDKTELDEQVGQVLPTTLADVDHGLRVVLDL